jgi:hypothetical protein
MADLTHPEVAGSTSVDPAFSAPHVNEAAWILLKGRVVTKPSDKAVELFREHLRALRAGREEALAQIEASQKMIEQSRALIVPD